MFAIGPTQKLNNNSQKLQYLILNDLFFNFQVSSLKEGKRVDGMCHSLTASYIRAKHKTEPGIPVCQLYEVCFL